MLVLAHMVLMLRAQPFQDSTDDLLGSLACLCLLMMLLMGLFLRVQGDDTTDEGKMISGAILTFMYCSVMVLGTFAIAMAIPCCKRKCFKDEDLDEDGGTKKKKVDTTKVMPLVSKRKMSSSKRAEALTEMKEARLKYGASSKEYKAAAKKLQGTESSTNPKKRAPSSKGGQKKQTTPTSASAGSRSRSRSNDGSQKKKKTAGGDKKKKLLARRAGKEWL
jgi:hypothetical protein